MRMFSSSFLNYFCHCFSQKFLIEIVFRRCLSIKTQRTISLYVSFFKQTKNATKFLKNSSHEIRLMKIKFEMDILKVVNECGFCWCTSVSILVISLIIPLFWQLVKTGRLTRKIAKNMNIWNSFVAKKSKLM